MPASLFAIKNPESAFERLRRVLPQAIRFVGSGLLVFPLGLGISALCHEYFKLPEELATAVAIFSLLLINFALGRRFVFRSTGRLKRQFARFAAIAVVMRAAEYSMFLGIFKVLHMPYLPAMMSALVVSSMIKFVAYRSWVFDADKAAHAPASKSAK